MSQANSPFIVSGVELHRTPLLILPPEVAERIAAGEVIERPVSAVKELVENALDAGARDIRVELRGGGLRLVRITDDGYGMPENELEHVCERHTTSKISTVEDLSHLHTLGFRGEALASIAAVAEVTLVSRAIETEAQGEEHPALQLTIRGGKITQRGRRARLHGTTVTVRDLFYNVPARLKFMHGARTENGHVVQLLRRYVVGYPSVRFNLTIDEHVALQTSGSGDLTITLAELYHLPLHEMLYPVDVSDGIHYTIHGYIGNRVLAQSNRQYVTLFINGRWIQSKPLQEALEQGYRSLLPKGKHPLLVLYIDLPPAEVDANVHPAKTEVRLEREDAVIAALTQMVRAVLECSPALPAAVNFPGPVLANQRRLPGPRRRGLHIAESAEGYRAEQAVPGTAEIIASLRPLAQLQQALLLEPVIVEMKRYQADLLEQRLPMLRGLGLECERFGGRSFLIRSVPTSEGNEQLVAHLQELAEIASEDSPDWEDHLLIGLACRSAMRRGRELGLGEQTTLLKSLASVSAPAVCPHGSPILLHYSRTFLIDKFDW